MEGLQTNKSEVTKPHPEIGEVVDGSMYIIGGQTEVAPSVVTQPEAVVEDTTDVTLETDYSILPESQAVDQTVQTESMATPYTIETDTPDLKPEAESVEQPASVESEQDFPNGLEVSIDEPKLDDASETEQTETQEAAVEFNEVLKSEMAAIESEFHLPPDEVESVQAALGMPKIITDLSDKFEKYLHETGMRTRKYPKTEITEEYLDKRESLKNFEGGISPEFIKEAREAATKVFEGRGLFTLSKEDFNNHFVSDEEFDAGPHLEQANVGNCYLVAALHAMSRSPNFETICRASTKRHDDGSWEIKLPLLGDEGDIITLTREEMGPQAIEPPDGDSEGGQKLLYPLRGKLGFRALEAAYTKHKFGSVDRQASFSGNSDEALLRLGGDNFFSYSFSSFAEDPKDPNHYVHLGLGSLDTIDQAQLDHYLEGFDPETHIATAATKLDAGSKSGKYRVEGTAKYLIPKHAYSVSKVDAKNKLITVANPWDTTKPISLTFDQFKDSFGRLDAVRINNGKLLSRMTNKANVV